MKMVMMTMLGLTVAACGRTPPPRPIEVQTQTVEVQVRAPCPDPAERQRLRVGRPARLADQPMPATARERVAQTTAQLGRYEAPGGWADQVDAAFDRCQQP